MAAGDETMHKWFPRLLHNETLHVVEVSFSDMLDGVKDGKWDIALCGIYQTPERAAEIDFLPAYLNSGLRLLVRSRPLPSLTFFPSLSIPSLSIPSLTFFFRKMRPSPRR